MLDRLRSPWSLAALLFAVAAIVRLCFLTATPDANGPFSPYYKGDAPLWLAYGAALEQGRPFGLEQGLPFRPPATAWLVAALWDGTAEGLRQARIGFALLGAALAPVTLFAARRLGLAVAACAAAAVAVGTGPLLLSASINSEVPYALLAVAGIGLLPTVASQPRVPGTLAVFGLLSGCACLFRAEHALVLVLQLAWLVLRWRRGGALARRSVAGRMAIVLVATALPLAPWQVDAVASVARYNRVEHPPSPARRLPWGAAATAALDQVPGFARAATQRFVEDVARHRGWGRVDETDLRAVMDDAFGCWPSPLPPVFLVALYGPLNFRLANGPEADGGFSRAALDAPPPLVGGAGRYPPGWLASLPRGGSLALEYPPHLEMVVQGYHLGLAWMVAHPVDAAWLVARKLWITWGGVAHGVGGRMLPFGASGVRNRVDITVPCGGLATAWRLVILALLVYGASRGARRAEAWPWLLWIGAGVLTTAAFFGYARFGAMLAPAFGVLGGLGIEPLVTRRPRHWARAGVVVLVVVVSLEVVRCLWPPAIHVDGQPAGVVEPFAPLEFEVRRVEAR